MTRLRVAVIPTTGRVFLKECLEAIQPQVDHTFLILHNCWPRIADELGRLDPVTLVSYNRVVPNISEMWNIGIDCAERFNNDREDWGDGRDLAILNDDAIVPDGWFAAVTHQMRDYKCVAGSSDQFGLLGEGGPAGAVAAYRTAEPIDMSHRMSGFAFILDGDEKLRLDEQFQWWYGDDDLEWRAREAGGVVKVAGYPVKHWAPGQSTVGELAVIAGEDRARFAAKWGRTPH